MRFTIVLFLGLVLMMKNVIGRPKFYLIETANETANDLKEAVDDLGKTVHNVLPHPHLHVDDPLEVRPFSYISYILVISIINILKRILIIKQLIWSCILLCSKMNEGDKISMKINVTNV